MKHEEKKCLLKAQLLLKGLNYCDCRNLPSEHCNVYKYSDTVFRLIAGLKSKHLLVCKQDKHSKLFSFLHLSYPGSVTNSCMCGWLPGINLS